MSTVQVLSSRWGANPTTTLVTYWPLTSALGLAYTGESFGRQIWRAAGTLRNLVAIVSAAPGDGNAYTFTLRVNGADTALTCTISGATDTTARDTSHEVSVAVGDFVSISVTPSSGPTNSTATQVSIEFEGEDAGTSSYGFPPQGVPATAGTSRNGLLVHDALTWTTNAGSTVANVVAVAGAFTSLHLFTQGAVTAGQTYTGLIYKNGVAQNGAGGTPNTTVVITGPATNAASTFSLPVSSGDVLYLEVVTSNNSMTQLGAAVGFTATTDGEALFPGGAVDTLPSAVTEYNVPGLAGMPTWTNTESARTAVAGVTGFTLDQMSVVLQAAPGAGNSYVFTLRQNGATPAGGPAVTIAGTDTTGSDLSNAAALADGDSFDVECNPDSTPDASAAQWCFRQMTAGVSASVSPSVSESISPSVSASASASLSPSVSPSLSISQSESPSVSPSVSASASPSQSPSVSPSVSGSGSPSVSGSVSPSRSPSVSPSVSPSTSSSGSPSASASVSPSVSSSASASKSPSQSPSASPSVSPSVSASASPSIGVPETTAIRRLRRAPHVSMEMDEVFYPEFEIDFETGVGLVTGWGATPQVMLRWSDDGGHTWSNESWASAGKIGQRSARVVWRRLGRSRDRVFEVVVSDPVKWVMLDAYLYVERGTN